MSKRTADQLWGWLLACTKCGKPHEYRLMAEGSKTRTWASPVDGHDYATREPGMAWALYWLRAEWDQETA